MPWRKPKYKGEFPSLGWALVEWWENYLTVPSGPLWGQPFVCTDEQIRYVVRLYRIDPETGQFVYRRAAKREAKGKGKSPEAAALAIGEFAGPVVFDGWDTKGNPVGRPHLTPWVQVAACSEDQTGNTYSALYEMLRDSPLLEEGVDLGLTRVFRKGTPGRIEPVTASAGSREGQPVTFAVLDETHLWLPNNGGKRLAATIRRNVAKMSGRTVETTNAFVPGEKSVAEASHEAAAQNEPGLLYVATEAPWVDDLTDKRSLKKALKVAYGDSTWVDLDRIVAEVQDPATDPADARRYYLNQLVKGEGRAIDPKRWAELTDAERVVADGDLVALGFDGSISDDSTALIGCTPDGHLFEVQTWNRPLGRREWRVPRSEVHEAVAAARDRYEVGRMFCDPAKWWSEIEEWEQAFGPDPMGDAIVVMFDTNAARRMAPACDRFATSVTEGSVSHDGSSTLADHIAAMGRKKVRVADADDDGRTKFVFVKADTRKIDAGIGAVLALEAAQTLIATPEPAVRFL